MPLEASCPHCDSLTHMLIAAGAEVVRRGIEARERGPAWGLLVTDPARLPTHLEGTSDAEIQAMRAAQRHRLHVVCVVSVADLQRIVRAYGQGSVRQRHDVRGILGQLNAPPPPGHVHTMAANAACVAGITSYATPDVLAAVERQEAGEARMLELLEQGRRAALRMLSDRTRGSISGQLFLVCPTGDAILKRLQPDAVIAVLAAAAPSGVYVGLHRTGAVLRVLPLDNPGEYDKADAERIRDKLRRDPPRGEAWVVVVNDRRLSLAKLDTAAVPPN